ncbi:P-loop NTPase [Microbacteriaceae bacterium VKM Ac-2855]|nr:P-loop NTPase [Microbacteriaceae bacterium VKM Ac-2855]
MIAIALAVPGASGDRLALDAYDAGHELVARADSHERLLQVVRDVEMDAVIVSAVFLDRAVLSAADARGVRLVAVFADEAGRRHAATVGVLDAVAVETPWTQLERLAVSPMPAREAEPRARGRITAVWGPAGAPGRSTVAMAVAAELAARGRSVALLDADTYGGSIAPALGLLDEAPGFAAACRLASIDGLTLDELDRVAQLSGSIRVLTGISRGRRWPELTAERVARVIEFCTGWVQEVVIDVGFNLETDEEIMTDLFAPRRNAATLTALQKADRILAVAAAEPVGLTRYLRAHEDLLETVNDVPISVVLNRVRGSAVGMGAATQAASALIRFGGIEPAATLPHDIAAVDAAVLAGCWVRDIAPRSAFARAAASLVTAVLVPEETAAPLPPPRRRRRAARRRLWTRAPM